MSARLLIALLCTLIGVHGAARAEGARACTSIAQRDCAPLPRVSTDHDLRVEIFTRQRTIWFPMSQSEAAEDLRTVCTGGKCRCDEHVQFFEFKGRHPGFRQVNATERSAASTTHCSLENANVNRDTLAFAVSAHLISTAISELEYCHTCGGSCHGQTVLSTFDGDTGERLRLGLALKSGVAEVLRRHMIDYIVAKSGDDAGAPSLRARLARELAARNLLDEGVYAERGTLYVNLDSFALSCADGSFHPVPVPKELIAPGFAALLN